MNNPQRRTNKQKGRGAHPNRRRAQTRRPELDSVESNSCHPKSPSCDNFADDCQFQAALQEVNRVAEVVDVDDMRVIRAVVESIRVLSPDKKEFDLELAKTVLPIARDLRQRMRRRLKQEDFFEKRVLDIVRLKGAQAGWERAERDLIQMFVDGAKLVIRRIYDFKRWVGAEVDLQIMAIEIGQAAYEAWLNNGCQCAKYMHASRKTCALPCCKPQHRASGWDPSSGPLRFFVFYHVFGIQSGTKFLPKLFASSMSRHLFNHACGLIIANVVFPVCKTCGKRLADELTPCACQQRCVVEWRLEEEVPILPDGLFGQYQVEKWVCCTRRRTHGHKHCNCAWPIEEAPPQCTCCGGVLSQGKTTVWRFMGDLSTVYQASDGAIVEIELRSATADEDLQNTDEWFNFLQTIHQAIFVQGRMLEVKTAFLALLVEEREIILLHLADARGCEDLYDLFKSWHDAFGKQNKLSE